MGACSLHRAARFRRAAPLLCFGALAACEVVAAATWGYECVAWGDVDFWTRSASSAGNTGICPGHVHRGCLCAEQGGWQPLGHRGERELGGRPEGRLGAGRWGSLCCRSRRHRWTGDTGASEAGHRGKRSSVDERRRRPVVRARETPGFLYTAVECHLVSRSPRRHCPDSRDLEGPGRAV